MTTTPTEPTAPNSTYTGTDSDVPFTATATFEDAAGYTVPPDDVPVWATSDPTIATVEASADGTSATFTVVGRAGSCTATCSSVNKSGTKIVLQGAIIIAAGDATQGALTLPTGPTAGTTPEVPVSDPTAPSTSETAGTTAPAGTTDPAAAQSTPAGVTS